MKTMKTKTLLMAIVLAVINTHSATAERSEETGWYVDGYTENTARTYLTGNAYLDLVEGIWQSSDGYIYAIEKDVENGKRSSGSFRVVVLSSSYDGWK